MHQNLLIWTTALGAAASLTLSSCTYDPYYSSVEGAYSSGYGDGYGYGGSGFSTSFFVSTGDPYWGYDPYTYCYYDYRSRRYYDPYLYGYYPIGYRPYAVYGVPHPYGWRRGQGHCPPPRTVRNVTVNNYRNRESAYRNSNYSWANQVRQRPDSGRRAEGQRQDRGANTRPGANALQPGFRDSYQRPDSGARQSRIPGYPSRTISESRSSPSQTNALRQSQERSRRIEESRSNSRSRLEINRPPMQAMPPAVRQSPRPSEPAMRTFRGESSPRQAPAPAARSRGEGNARPVPAAPAENLNPPPSPASQQERSPGRSNEARPSSEGGRGLRSLGDG